MPVIRKEKQPESPQHNELVKRLVAELQRNQPAGGPPDAPIIVEDVERNNFMRVTVLWDDWKDIAPEARGRIIMDAYEQQRPQDVINITMALGSTPNDAERLGIRV